MSFVRCFLLMLLLTTTHTIHASEDESIPRGLMEFTGARLFVDLPVIAGQGRKCFTLLAFLILVGSSISYYNKSKGTEAIIKHSILAMAIGITIAKIPEVINGVDIFTTVLSQSLGNRNARNCLNDIYKISHELSSDQNPIEEELDNKSKFSLTSAVAEIRIWISTIFEKCMRWIVLQILSFWLWIFSFICTVFEAIQYFLIHMGSMVLPVFLAGLTTSTFRNQSVNFIYGFLGIMCWPVGWSIGHMGTASMVAFAIRVVQSDLRFDNTKVISICTANMLNYLKYSPIGVIIPLLIIFLCIGLWVGLVTISAPWLIQKLVVSGGQFFSGLVQGFAQNSMNAAGMALNRGFSAVENRQDKNPQGPNIMTASNSNPVSNHSPLVQASKMSMKESIKHASGKALLGMGYGAARLLTNMSKFDGDPSHLTHVLSRNRSHTSPNFKR